MSRIGNKVIPIPKGVKLNFRSNYVDVEGPLGSITQRIHSNITFKQEGDSLQVIRPNDTKENKALHGLVRALVANAVNGVTKGFEKKLDIVGTGYNAKLKGKHLELQIGFCLPYSIMIPEGITLEVPNPTKIVVKGCDKQQVGQFAANIRFVRPPEPYKGKGIKYEDEVIKRKAGKSFGAGG